MVSIFSISINLVVFNVISRVDHAMHVDAHATHHAPLWFPSTLRSGSLLQVSCLLYLVAVPVIVYLAAAPVIVYISLLSCLSPCPNRQKKSKKSKTKKKLFLGLLLSLLSKPPCRLIVIPNLPSHKIPRNFVMQSCLIIYSLPFFCLMVCLSLCLIC